MTALLLAALLLAAPASAQPAAEPPRAIRVIVQFGPGGSNDIVARLLADALGREAPMVVENRAGAAGLIGTEACARAPADGSVLCIGTTATHTILPLLHPDRGLAEAFAPVTRIGTQPQLIAVNPAVPARDLAGLIDWLRRNPGRAVGSAGASTLAQLAAVALERRLGLELLHVTYRSGEASALAAAQGEVPVTVNQLAALSGHLRAGRLVPIALTGAHRVAALPEVPTLAESLGPDFTGDSYIGIFAPAGTRPAVVAALHARFAAALAQPALRQRLVEIGVEPAPLDPAGFAAAIAEEPARWRGLVAP